MLVVNIHYTVGGKKVKPFRLGQSHLISCGKDFEKVIFFPSSLKLLGMNATFSGFLLFEQVEGKMA